MRRQCFPVLQRCNTAFLCYTSSLLSSFLPLPSCFSLFSRLPSHMCSPSSSLPLPPFLALHPLLYMPPASRADLANTNMTECPLSHLTHSQSSHSPSLQAAFLIPHTSPLTHLGISSGSHLLLHSSLFSLPPSIPTSASIHSAASWERAEPRHRTTETEWWRRAECLRPRKSQH